MLFLRFLPSASPSKLKHPLFTTTTYLTRAHAVPPPTILLFQHTEDGKYLRQQMHPTRSMPSARSSPSHGSFSPNIDLDCPRDDNQKVGLLLSLDELRVFIHPYFICDANQALQLHILTQGVLVPILSHLCKGGVEEKRQRLPVPDQKELVHGQQTQP